MADIKWPDDLQPPVLYERCLYDGQSITPTTDPLRLCNDCLGIEPDGYNNHGTTSGVTWHRRHGVPVCGPCLMADREARSARRRARKACPHCSETIAQQNLQVHIKRKHSAGLVPA